MDIKCECEWCGKKYRVNESRAGSRIECRECGEEIRVPGSRRKRGAHQTSSNSLVIGLAGAIVLLVGVVGGLLMRGGQPDDQPIVEQPASPVEIAEATTQSPQSPVPELAQPAASVTTSRETSNNSTAQTGIRRVSDSTSAHQKTIPQIRTKRIGASATVAEEERKALLGSPTPTAASVRTAPFVGSGGVGIRVPETCLIEDVTNTEAELGFNVIVPGTRTGILDFTVKRDGRYTADTTITVITARSFRFVGRGEVISAPGAESKRRRINGLNFWEIRRPTDEGGLDVRFVGFAKGMRIELHWESSDSEGSDVQQAMDAIVASFSRSAQEARLPETVIAPSTTPPTIAATIPANNQAATAPQTAWSTGQSLNIPMERSTTTLIYSPTPSRLALIGNVIHDLQNGQPIQTLPEYRFDTGDFSPNGAWFATTSASQGKVEGNVLVFPVGKPDSEALELVIDDQPAIYRCVCFLSDSRLLVSGDLAKGGRTAIWNLDTLKIERRLEQPISRAECTASSDGKYLATASASEVKVLSTETSREVAHMEKPRDTEGLPFGMVNGLAFSPDTSELAMLNQGRHFTVWSNRGKIILRYELSESFKMPPNRGENVIWMPDGSGWLLFGRLLLHRDGMVEAWRVKSRFPYERYPTALLPGNRILVAQGRTSQALLADIDIPFDQIEQTKEAFKSVPPLLKEGDSVTLDLKMDSVRFATESEVRTALVDAITQRLARGKIGVADGNPITLRVKYGEKPGEQRRIVDDLAGRLTGKGGVMAQDSVCTMELELVVDGRPGPVWSDKFSRDAGLIIDGEANDTGLRNSAFKSLMINVKQMDLPLRLSSDPDVKLPLVTSVGLD